MYINTKVVLEKGEGGKVADTVEQRESSGEPVAPPYISSPCRVMLDIRLRTLATNVCENGECEPLKLPGSPCPAAAAVWHPHSPHHVLLTLLLTFLPSPRLCTLYVVV